MDMTLPFQIPQLSKNKRETNQKAYRPSDGQTIIPNNMVSGK